MAFSGLGDRIGKRDKTGVANFVDFCMAFSGLERGTETTMGKRHF